MEIVAPLRADTDLSFQTLADALPNQVWTATPGGELNWFNTRVYEFSGARLGELDGAGWGAIVHPDDLSVAIEHWTAALHAGQSYETEFRLRRRDGIYRWHIARAVPLHDGAGRVIRWIGTNTDIHDQKLVAEALAESEARLRLAIEAGRLAVWELDLANNRVTPSAALNRLYGFPDDASPTVEELRSRYAPGEAERLEQEGAAVAARGGTELETEVRHIMPGGEVKWYMVRAQLAPPASGSGPRAIGVIIDVTAQKLTEQRLQQSERRMRLSQEAAGIASLELDIASGNVVGSDNFWDLWGLSPRENVHISTLEKIVLPEDADVRSNPETRKTGTAVQSVEYRIRRPDTGELRWLSRHIEFVHDVGGRPATMFGVMQDITDKKEAQARQELLTHELEHRIKNILATVSAIASQTLKDSDLETARAEFIERLRALSNAHDVLTKARWTNASIREVLDATLATFPTDRIALSGIDLRIEARPALSLALAVNELATNATKYGALSVPGGRVDITWSAEPGGEPGRLAWQWRESGGPLVTKPSRRGFGTFLIERVLAADFGGTVSIDYAPTGVTCLLDAPFPNLPQSKIGS